MSESTIQDPAVATKGAATTLQGTPNPEAPNPQLPIVQKLQIRYAKRGRLRFTSHRDFCRAFERAIRRAGLPIAFSSGFTPHPKISYAGASPTGAASEAEYLEIGLTRALSPQQVSEALDAALPPGLDIIAVIESPPGSLADRLQASQWDIRVPEVELEQLAEAVQNLLESDQVEVERMTKRGLRQIDVREAVVSLTTRRQHSDSDGCAILTVVLRHLTPSVRPDDVLTGLRSVSGLSASVSPIATRTAQGPLDPQTGTVGDPFASDRDASS